MTSKLDLKAISEYAQKFSNEICENFFAKNEKISGPEILNITSIEQVNVFAIKGLYENWKQTTEAFKSPFFDFENEKVKAALTDFMNIVSQNIAVKKAEFLPILSKACQEALQLSLNPAEYYDAALRDMPNFKCTQENANQFKKYARINVKIAEDFAHKFAENEAIFTNEALSMMENIIEDTHLDDADLVLAQFSNIIPCDKTQFLKNKNNTEKSQSNETSSFFDEIIKPKTNNSVEDVPKKEVVVDAKPAEAKKVEKTEPTTLNDTYQSSQPTLNEQLTDNDAKNLADLHQSAPVQNLAASISLNQKFVFINKLFNGDSAAFNETIQILENCSSTEEAISLLKYKYAPKYQWNLNSDEADELIDILKRKA